MSFSHIKKPVGCSRSNFLSLRLEEMSNTGIMKGNDMVEYAWSFCNRWMHVQSISLNSQTSPDRWSRYNLFSVNCGMIQWQSVPSAQLWISQACASPVPREVHKRFANPPLDSPYIHLTVYYLSYNCPNNKGSTSKIIGTFRSEIGSQNYQYIASLLSTWMLKGKSMFVEMDEILRKELCDFGQGKQVPIFHK